MLTQCRNTRLPKLHGQQGEDKLAAHIKAYNNMLLGMPTQMAMKGAYVRPHLVRKHMLAEAAGCNQLFARLTFEGL